MHAAEPGRMSYLRLFAATYRLRWPLIAIGYLSAAVLTLVPAN